MFKKWAGPGPLVPPFPVVIGEPVKFQKKCVEIVGDMIKTQCKSVEAQFDAGLKNIEEVFHLTEVKNSEELCAKTADIWQKAFESVRQTCEAQVRDFQGALVKWTELVTK